MIDIQGTPEEQEKISSLLDGLAKTKTGEEIIRSLSDKGSSVVLKFGRGLGGRGRTEENQVLLDPNANQNQLISTLGHELAHETMLNDLCLAQHNATSLDEYALIRLLFETHGWMAGDSILQELDPVCAREHNIFDLTTQEGRTKYLRKALSGKAGYAEWELQKIEHIGTWKSARDADPEVFRKCCATFLETMYTKTTLDEVLQTKPYSEYKSISMSQPSLWQKITNFFTAGK